MPHFKMTAGYTRNYRAKSLTERVTPMYVTLLNVFHVLISLIGIASGFVVIFAFLGSRLSSWTRVFLATTVLTSATGFLYPVHKFLPSHAIGILSLLFLGLAIFALYARRLAGGWSRTYVISAVISQFLNFFVLVVQLFLKVPALKALAPTQTEPPFKIAQLCTLVVFIILGIFCAIRFKSPKLEASKETGRVAA
jgi:hypothetical protein